MKLSDLADAIDSAENVKQAAWMNDTPAVIVNIQRQPGSNVIEVVNRIKELLPQLQSALPSAVHVTVLTDRTTTIRGSVEDVQFELMLAVVLVVLVIFLFLRNLPATIIPSVAVPVSLVGTFGVMYLLGFSLNNLTLMAMTIATGFVVDDAIVMIENVARYIEQGDPPLQAALKGSEQIAFTILSLTISLIAVLIPVLFMGEVVGRLFREFAITLGVTILISAVVSLTLTPMMCARLLKHTPEEQQSRLFHASQRVYDRIIDFYATTLRWVLKHQTGTLLVAVATLVLTVLLYIVVPKGFFPVQDTGIILGISEAPQSISFPAMAERQQALARVILKDPAVASLSTFIGVDGTNTTLNSGRVLINLKPLAERRLSASEIIRRLQPRLDQLEGIRLFMQPVQDLTVEDRVSRTQYQYSLEDPNINELNTWTPRLVAALQELPELRDVSSDQQNQGLQVYLTIDRSTASRLGITPAAHRRHPLRRLRPAQVSTIFTQLNQYRVILEVKPDFQQHPRKLNDIYIRSAGGGKVPLSAITRVEETTGPLVISHQGQFPATTLSFNLAPGVSLGEAVQAMEATTQEAGAAAQHPGQFPGHGPGLPGLPEKRTAVDPGGPDHGLHRPGGAVRKLHPPHHHHLHPAVGRGRGDSGPAPLPHRVQRHCPDRHHPADRHRQEERHHDGGLRPGRRAPGRQAPGGGHLSGLPVAVPAHHDDHHGGAVGGAAPGHRHRPGLRTAPPAGHLHRRRPDLQPGAHPLYHSGHLSLVRSAGPAAAQEPRRR